MSWRGETKMKWVGLTGGIATGKSTVARILRELGIPVVCADELARQVVKSGSEGFAAVVAEFGADILGPDGELDRRKLGAQVFADASLRARLESIVHPLVRAEQSRRREDLARSGASLAFYDVPLLFEKNLEEQFDATVVVLCDEGTQLSRLTSRDHLTIEEAKRRIAAQLPLAEKRRRADHVIDNNGSLEDLRAAVRELLVTLSRPPT